MDLFDMFAGADSFHVRKLLEHARGLNDEQLDRPLRNPAHVFPWPTPAQSLRDLVRRLVQTKELWTAAIGGGTMPNVLDEPAEQATPDALIARFERADLEFGRILGDVRNRNAWSDTFVDALCEPPETFSFGGMFAHVITFNTYQRLLALDALRRLGVKVEGFGVPDGIRGQSGATRQTQDGRRRLSIQLSEPFAHENAGHGPAGRQQRLSTLDLFKPVRPVERNAGQGRLDVDAPGSVCPRVVFGEPQQLRSDPATRRAAPDVDRDTILLIVYTMAGKTQHGRLTLDRADGDEKDFTAFHGLHVHIRRQAGAPQFDDVGRVEVRAYRMNRIQVRREDGFGVGTIRSSGFDRLHAHNEGCAIEAARASGRLKRDRATAVTRRS